MPRRATPFVPTHYYHFYNRGHNRQAIFFKAANYVFFLRGFKKYLRPSLDILAYCLMPTHYHILGRVKSDKDSVATSRAMQRLSISYTKTINHHFGRIGALFQGQFQGKPVPDEQYLQHLCVYIHANPVKDGLVPTPEAWPYSNYLEWVGLRPGTLVDLAFIQEHFGSAAQYAARVLAYQPMPAEVRTYLNALES